MVTGNLDLNVFGTRQEMGMAGACMAAAEIRRMLKTKKTVNILFAAAPSQDDILGCLVGEEGIDWNRVNAFHMDEYIGLDKTDPRSFGVMWTKTVGEIIYKFLIEG